MSKINSLAVKLLNATAPKANNGIKVGISLRSGQPQWSTRRVPGCVPTVTPGGHKLLRRVQRSPHSLCMAPGAVRNSQAFRGLASQREGSRVGGGGSWAARREGEGAGDTHSDPSAWRGRRTSPSNGIMHAPAGRISHLAGQLNQTLSP